MFDPETKEEVMVERNWEVPESVRWEAFITEVLRTKTLWTEKCEGCKEKNFDQNALQNERKRAEEDAAVIRAKILEARAIEKEKAEWQEMQRLRELEKKKYTEKEIQDNSNGRKEISDDNEMDDSEEEKGRKIKKKRKKNTKKGLMEWCKANGELADEHKEDGDKSGAEVEDSTDTDVQKKKKDSARDKKGKDKTQEGKKKETDGEGGEDKDAPHIEERKFVHRKSDEWTESEGEETDETKTKRPRPSWLGRKRPWPPPRVILVEGFLLFSHPPASSLFDRKIFLTVPNEICRDRR